MQADGVVPPRIRMRQGYCRSLTTAHNHSTSPTGGLHDCIVATPEVACRVTDGCAPLAVVWKGT